MSLFWWEALKFYCHGFVLHNRWIIFYTSYRMKIHF